MSNLIQLVQQLRERTGAGMMDCKKALEASDLDMDKAVDWLRQKGIAKSASKGDRIAAEGASAIRQSFWKSTLKQTSQPETTDSCMQSRPSLKAY